ncbi:hypothetical protein BFJ69_g865 [Fusarium oxysporum]|uniref:Actin-like ATPase domain-containing protein n=1 Tax=Fusarium oxysporum TaxID=5507 RepID=A0A420P277_FUSOX|nr:hypothetical protein BFJ69_g865 [Fusarium oxysporum]
MASGQGLPTMVIAIDLGNISSGVAWAMLNAPNSKPKFVTGWETLSGNPSDDVKVPSTLYYGEAKNRNNLEWGFKVPDDRDVLSWFKHLIVDDKDLPDHIRFSPQLANAKRIMRKVQKTPVEIVGDYLKQLWLHSWEHITQSDGLGENPVINVLICITSPATWPSSARVRIIKALAHAGLLNYFPRDRFGLRFFTDISMAAFAAIDDHAERRGLELGDVIIACDAGGGTVDVVSYVVTSHDPFMVTEYTKADGKLPLHMSHIRTNVVTAGEMCGAIFLRDKFSAAVKPRISPGVRERVRDHALSKAIDHVWRSDISPFVHEEINGFDVKIPVALSTTADPKISIPIKVVRNQIYGPLVEKINNLLQEQIALATQTFRYSPEASLFVYRSSSYTNIIQLIILTGGFGLSPYLHKILVDRIPDVKLIMEAGQGAFFDDVKSHSGDDYVHHFTLKSDPIPDINDLEVDTIAMRRARKVEYQLQVLFDRERIWFSVYYKNACLGYRSIPFDRE